MKNKKIMLRILALAIILSSCSITKRTYSDGYHVEWYHRNHKDEKITDSQKAENHKEDLTEALSPNSLIPEEDQTLTRGDLVPSPIKEEKAPFADRSNTVQHHPVPFVKNSLHKATKHVAQVKEKSSTKAMAILGMLVYILLCLIVLVLIIFIVSILI